MLDKTNLFPQNVQPAQRYRHRISTWNTAQSSRSRWQELAVSWQDNNHHATTTNRRHNWQYNRWWPRIRTQSVDLHPKPTTEATGDDCTMKCQKNPTPWCIYTHDHHHHHHHHIVIVIIIIVIIIIIHNFLSIQSTSIILLPPVSKFLAKKTTAKTI